MAAERIAPNAVLASSGLTGATLGNLDEDPDASDGAWAVASSNNTDTSVRLSFGSPAGGTPSGTQEFRALVRKQGGSGTPTARIEIWSAGALVRAGSDVAVSSTSGAVLSLTWDASEAASPEIQVYGTKSGGNPSSRAAIDIGAVEWNAEVSAPGVTGSLSRTLGAVGLAAAGVVAIAGAGSGALGLSGSAAGQVAVQGSGACALDALSSSAAGAVRVDGSGSGSLGLSLSASGSVADEQVADGQLAATLGELEVAAAGSVAVSGASSSALAVLSLASSGSVGIEGASTVGLASVALAASGEVLVSGDGAGALGLSGDGAGRVAIDGTASPTLGALALSASGSLGDSVGGSLAVGLALLELAASGVVAIEGAAAATLGLTGSGSGAVAIAGSLSAALGLTLQGTGAVVGELAGSLAVTLDPLSVEALGGVLVTAAVDVTLGSLTSSGGSAAAPRPAHGHVIGCSCSGREIRIVETGPKQIGATKA